MTETPPEFLPDLPDLCWPVDPSCIPGWDVPEVDGGWTADQKARAMALAVQSLRMLTAYRMGGCPVVVRPATQRCRSRTWAAYPVTGTAPWQPVSIGGEWLNLSCGHSAPCGCLATREVRLPGPATHVVEVKVDGMTLDESAYRLDPGGRLVRLDGEGWPLCQNLADPDTALGTWSVTYLSGAPIDGLGAYVTGLLTVEFLNACTGGNCRLPTTVSQVVRNGVTLTMAPGAFPGGLTGIQEVDVWVQSINPNRHRIAPSVWSPDLPSHRRMAVPTIWNPAPEDIDGGTP